MCLGMFHSYRRRSNWTARSGNDPPSSGRSRHGRKRSPGRSWSRSWSAWTGTSTWSPRVRVRTSGILASSSSSSSRFNQTSTSKIATSTERTTRADVTCCSSSTRLYQCCKDTSMSGLWQHMAETSNTQCFHFDLTRSIAMCSQSWTQSAGASQSWMLLAWEPRVIGRESKSLGSVPRHHMHVYEHSYMVGRVGLLRSHCIHTLLVYKSASVWMQKTVTQFRWWHVWSMLAPSRRRWCRRSRQAARRPRRMYVDRSVFCTQDLTIGDPVGKAWRTSWTNCSVVSWEKTLEHEWFSHHYKPNHDILETQFLSFQDFADRGFSAREDEKLWCWQLDSFVIRQSTSHHGIVFRSIVDIPNICWLWFKITPFKKMSWYVIFLPNLLPVVPPSSPKCTAAFPVSDIIVHQFMI